MTRRRYLPVLIPLALSACMQSESPLLLAQGRSAAQEALNEIRRETEARERRLEAQRLERLRKQRLQAARSEQDRADDLRRRIEEVRTSLESLRAQQRGSQGRNTDRLDARIKELNETINADRRTEELRREIAALRALLEKACANMAAGGGAPRNDAISALQRRVEQMLERMQRLESPATPNRATVPTKAISELKVQVEEALDMLHVMDRKVAKLAAAPNRAAGSTAAIEAWTRRIDDRLGKLESSRREGEKRLVAALAEVRKDLLARVDGKLAAQDASKAAAAAIAKQHEELWKKLETRFASLETTRQAADQKLAQELSAAQKQIRSEIEAKLAGSAPAAAAELDKMWKKLEPRFAALTAERAKARNDLAAELEKTRQSLSSELTAKLATLAKPDDVPQLAAVETSISKLGDRFDEEHLRRTSAEKDLNMRLDGIGEVVTALNNEVRKSLSAAKTGGPVPGANDPWGNPWLWGLGIGMLGLLLWLLLRRDPRPESNDEVFVIDETSTPASRTESRKLAAAALDGSDERKAAAKPSERVVTASDVSDEQARPVEREPTNGRRLAPRVQSLRIAAEQTAPAGDQAVRGILDNDPRVLVEPAPRVEERPDGSLSIRFYVRGQVASNEAEALLEACRSAATNRRLSG